MPRNCFKRGGVWWARAIVEGQEHRASLGLAVERTTVKQAEAAAARWLDGLKAVARGDAPTRTFDEIAEHFIIERLPEISYQGARRYQASLRNLLPFFEGLALSDIGAETLRGFEKARRADNVSSSTIRRDLHCLSAAITFFGDSFDLDITNPVQRYLRRRAQQGALREAPGRKRYLSHDEEARLLASIRSRGQPPLLAECVELAIDTGLRLNEQFAMEWRDVDLRRGRVTVRNGKGKTPYSSARSLNGFCLNKDLGVVFTVIDPCHVRLDISADGRRKVVQSTPTHQIMAARLALLCGQSDDIHYSLDDVLRCVRHSCLLR